MVKRSIATLFLSAWFILFGVEAAEQAGYFEFADQDVDRSVDFTLLSLGTAVQLEHHEDNGIPSGYILPLSDPEGMRVVFRVPRLRALPQDPPSMREIPLRKLHCRFLI